ncbi:NTP pyrophosphohydrolase [Actinomyces sp.]|uniref:NTP pyrophosphohydrolase n=1 Tax=Actinomyces sp. TaxID=29317 RepID=UPI0026DBDE40|nr:NTP pyrophosphohydrolase [Actinomyces sp.]MDO4901380.1 NTP pyrophosphohydrolase [Actinomyces sp.]
MSNYVTWTVKSKSGRLEVFTRPQTPEMIADQLERQLTYPTFLTGGPRFALGVQPLPEGIDVPDDLPDDDPERMRYMQAAGSNRALTIEARVPDPDGGYTHYVLAREPIADPDRWVPLSWDNGSPEPYTIRLHPEEVFTGEQAVPVFRDYIINARLPDPQLLRVIDV